jgi:NAD(P)-dependent dehydrogenase (short-subunit alcohol dehydrogenase family)
MSACPLLRRRRRACIGIKPKERIINKLANKIAVVTGASKGIGAAIARRFATEGATVVVNYATSREGADKVVADIAAAGGKAVAIRANISVEADVRQLFQAVKELYGRVDLLAKELGPRGIRVNAISPGMTQTDGLQAAGTPTPTSSARWWR